MRYSYPCVLSPEEDGGFSVSFPDVPEAITCGDDRSDAIAMAEDALAGALAGYVQEQWDIPHPGPVSEGQDVVAVPPIAAAKVALYLAMREQGISKGDLGTRLGLSETSIDRLVNPDHRSHISQLQEALRAVGRTLVIEDRAA